jgi:hypothetical protein
VQLVAASPGTDQRGVRRINRSLESPARDWEASTPIAKGILIMLCRFFCAY